MRIGPLPARLGACARTLQRTLPVLGIFLFANAVICLQRGCPLLTAPALVQITPDEGTRAETVPRSMPVTFSVDFYKREDSEIKVTIDGIFQGAEGVRDTSSTRLGLRENQFTDLIDISRTAEPRAYEFGIIALYASDPFSPNPFEILLPSNSQLFFVNNPTGPKCPRLSSLAPGEASLGADLTLTLTGEHFEPDSTVQVSGIGVTTGPVSVNSPEQISVPVMISSSAQTGAHEVRVVTAGGTSNRRFFNTIAPRSAPVIDALLPNFGVPGRTASIHLFGSNFSPASVAVLVDPENPNAADELRASVHWRDTSELTASLQIPNSLPLGSRTFRLTTVSGIAERGLRVVDRQAETPHLAAVFPAALEKGANIYVECQGTHFARTGSGRGAFTVFAFGTGVSSTGGIARPPLGIEMTDRVIAEVRVAADAGSRANIGVVTPDILNSNPADVQLVEPPAGRPTLRLLEHGVIDPGAEQDDIVFGTNLQGVTQLDFSIPGMTFSNINVNADGTAITFHLRADESIEHTWQRRTNLRARSANRTSNEISYLVR